MKLFYQKLLKRFTLAFMNIHIYTSKFISYNMQKAVNKQDNSHRVQSPTLEQHQFGVIT